MLPAGTFPSTLKDFMATIATQKKQAAERLKTALVGLPASATAAVKMLQEKFAAKELSDEVIGVIASGSLAPAYFDKSGRWTAADTVNAYRPNTAKRRKTEDPIFETLSTALAQIYEVEGLTGVMRAMRSVVEHIENEVWESAGDREGWKLSGPLSLIVAGVDKRAQGEMKKHRDGEAYVVGLEQLDVLINGAKPAKKTAKAKTPAVAVPGTMTNDERTAFNAKMAAREKRAAAKAKK